MMALSAAQFRTNVGKNILEGKHIRIDEDGFENFDDYFTETDSDDSDVEIVNYNDDKIVAEDDARSSVSPLSLSNFPSRRRLSFPVDSMSDSCSDTSKEVIYVKRVISKRGMKSLANANTADSEVSDPQEAIPSKKDVTTTKTSDVTTTKTSDVTTTKTSDVSSAVSSSNSSNKIRLLSKRGMKSFPEDEESFQKAASTSKEHLASEKECSPTNVCDLPDVEPEITAKDGSDTGPSRSKECEETEDNLKNDDKTNNDDVSSEVVTNRKRMKMTLSESFSSERTSESPKKVISAFGVLKPTVQTHYFDVLETSLSLIDEIEKPSKKSTKIVKKPESNNKFAEKNKVNPENGLVSTRNNLKGTLDSEHKGVPSDVPKRKPSPLRHKRSKQSSTAIQTLKNKSVPQDKSSPLKHKLPQPSPTAKHTVKNKSVPLVVSEEKPSPSRHKKPQPTTEKPTLKSKSVPENKSSPSQHKKPRRSLTAKNTPKNKSIRSGKPKDKSSSLRHKKTCPSPIAKYSLKTKTEPKHKSSPLRHKKPQTPEKNMSKSKSVPSHVSKDKSPPVQYKKPRPSPPAKQTMKSKSVSEEKSPPSQHKKPQPTTQKPTLKSKNHINGGYITRSTRTKSLVNAVQPDNKSCPDTSSSFATKHTYRYISNSTKDPGNEQHIMYCCCLDSEKAFMGIISLKKGAYKQLNRSRNEMMFLVQFGKIKVRIGYKNMILTTGDSFMIPANEIYSLRNKSNHDCGLIVTILK